MGEMELPWKNALQYPKTQTLLSVPSADLPASAVKIFV
jgi:hypothetical protein